MGDCDGYGTGSLGYDMCGYFEFIVTMIVPEGDCFPMEIIV